jgi:hypothetical protein
MTKTVDVMWLGDEDPNAQLIRMGDLRFIKGEVTKVPEDHGYMEMISENPMFAVNDSKAEPAAADEPVIDPDEGTEKGAIKQELRLLGISVQGNPSLDTLRNRLADATK